MKSSVVPSSSDWITTRLAESAQVLDHLRVPISAGQRQRRPGPFPYCGANGVLDHIDDYMIDDDVVLLAEDGGNFDQFRSRPIAYRMKGKIWVNNHAHVLKAARGGDTGYLFYALVHKDIRPYISSSTRSKLTRGELVRIEVALPGDIAEQRRIAKVLTDTDSLTYALERLIVKKEAIKQGMMQQLLTGNTRLSGFTEPWVERAIGDVASVDPDSLGSATSAHEIIDYISLEDVSRGVLLRSSRIRFGDAPSRARRSIRNHDVLFGTVRPNLQSHLMYTGNLLRPVASTGFAVIRAIPGLADPRFLFYLLMSRLTVVQIDRIIAGSNYPAVSSKDIQRLWFSLPDTAEQAAVGAALMDCDTEIHMLRVRLAKTKDIKRGMMQELLTGRTRLPIGEPVPA